MTKLEQAARHLLIDIAVGNPTDSSLTALREALDHSGESNEMVVPNGYALISIESLKAWVKYDEVRNACQFPVEQAEQEPVAFRFPRDTESWTGGWTIDHKVIRSVDAEIEDNEFKPCLESVEQVLLALEKVYAAPQPMKQEPVAFQMICPRCKVDRVTTPCPNRGGVSDCPMTATAQNAAPVRTKDLTDFGCVPNSNGTTNQRGELLSALEALLEDYIHRVQDAWIEAGGSDISREEVLTNCEPARNAAAAIANMTGATDELP